MGVYGDIPPGTIFIPPGDLTTAAIDAIDLVLGQLGISPLDLLLSLFSGKPKNEDSDAVIAAYEQSAYWPLRVLGNNLAIAVKNGAPISDSRPAIQAQFGTWKQGTIRSIQGFAGLPPGPGSPGYWTLAQLINQSWAASGDGVDSVLRYVRAIDAITVQLSRIAQGATPPPSTPPPTVPPIGGAGGGQKPQTPPPPPAPTMPGDPCSGVSTESDEILDSCRATQHALQQIITLLTPETTAGQPKSVDPCCTAVVAAIAAVTTQLSAIATSLAFPPAAGGAVDLTAITAALTALVKAVGAYAPMTEAIASALTTNLPAIANSLGAIKPTDVSGVVDQLKTMVLQGDVPDAALEQMIADKVIPPQYSAVAQASPWAWVHAVLTFASSYSPLIGWAEHVLGDDADAVAGQRAAAARVDALLARGVKALKGIGPSTNAATLGQLGPLLKQYVQTTDAIILPVIEPFIAALENQLKPPGATAIGNIGVDPDAPVATAVGVALTAATAGWLLSFAGIDEGESLTHMVEMIGGLLGFEELRDVQIGPLIRNGIGQIAEMNARALFKQNVPGAAALAGLVARGLLTQTRYRQLTPYSGMPDELVSPELEAAYSGLTARRLMPLINTGLFTQADLSDEMTFAGMRQKSQARMLLAAPYLATNTQRNQLITELEAAYVAGILSEADLTSQIDSAENNTDRDNLILTRVHYQKLVAATKALETEYVTLYKAGLFTDAQLNQNLTAIGLQPDVVSSRAAVAEAQVNATLHKKAIAEAAALERATAAKEREAAVLNFMTGHSDAAALAVALIATGLTATQAAAWTDLAVLRKGGALRWKFGLQLPAAQATLLGQRVSALTDQRKRLQISDAQYVQGLQALGIPATYVNALQATADAMISPKSAAFPVPVSTS